MAWWSWLILGFVLLGLEIVTPTGFFLIMFGFSAIIVGGILALGVPVVWYIQWVIFVVLSLLSALFILKKSNVTTGRGALTGTIGAQVEITKDILPNEIGEGQLWGAPWKVKNIGNKIISTGTRCIVKGLEGVTLHVSTGE